MGYPVPISPYGLSRRRDNSATYSTTSMDRNRCYSQYDINDFGICKLPSTTPKCDINSNYQAHVDAECDD